MIVIRLTIVQVNLLEHGQARNRLGDCVMLGTYSVSSSSVFRYGSGPTRSGNSWSYQGTKFTAVLGEAKVSKGTSLLGTVKSDNKSTYPNDAEQNGYWYVYKGLQ